MKKRCLKRSAKYSLFAGAVFLVGLSHDLVAREHLQKATFREVVALGAMFHSLTDQQQKDTVPHFQDHMFAIFEDTSYSGEVRTEALRSLASVPVRGQHLVSIVSSMVDHENPTFIDLSDEDFMKVAGKMCPTVDVLPDRFSAFLKTNLHRRTTLLYIQACPQQTKASVERLVVNQWKMQADPFEGYLSEILIATKNTEFQEKMSQALSARRLPASQKKKAWRSLIQSTNYRNQLKRDFDDILSRYLENHQTPENIDQEDLVFLTEILAYASQKDADMSLLLLESLVLKPIALEKLPRILPALASKSKADRAVLTQLQSFLADRFSDEKLRDKNSAPSNRSLFVFAILKHFLNESFALLSWDDWIASFASQHVAKFEGDAGELKWLLEHLSIISDLHFMKKTRNVFVVACRKLENVPREHASTIEKIEYREKLEKALQRKDYVAIYEMTEGQCFQVRKCFYPHPDDLHTVFPWLVATLEERADLAKKDINTVGIMKWNASQRELQLVTLFKEVLTREYFLEIRSRLKKDSSFDMFLVLSGLGAVATPDDVTFLIQFLQDNVNSSDEHFPDFILSILGHWEPASTKGHFAAILAMTRSESTNLRVRALALCTKWIRHATPADFRQITDGRLQNASLGFGSGLDFHLPDWKHLASRDVYREMLSGFLNNPDRAGDAHVLVSWSHLATREDFARVFQLVQTTGRGWELLGSMSRFANKKEFNYIFKSINGSGRFEDQFTQVRTFGILGHLQRHATHHEFRQLLDLLNEKNEFIRNNAFNLIVEWISLATDDDIRTIVSYIKRNEETLDVKTKEFYRELGSTSAFRVGGQTLSALRKRLGELENTPQNNWPQELFDVIQDGEKRDAIIRSDSPLSRKLALYEFQRVLDSWRKD